MKIHTGDTVVVITGKDKGKTGTVIRVLQEKNRLVVEGINMRVKHIKKTPQGAGQRIKFEAALSASNVMLVDPKSKKRTRVGFKVDEKGRKTRIAKRSGEVVKTVSAVKAKKTDKKTDAKAAPKAGKAKADETVTLPIDAPKSAEKSPFWKRMGFGSQAQADAAGAGGPDKADVKAAPTQHRAQGG